MINVLWIDDQPNNAFIDKAYNADIYIDVKTNVDDGISALLSSSVYDAIILDANCISHPDRSREPEITALGYALRKITEHKITTPWFVYSGGGFEGESSIEITVNAYERLYDDKSWYRKPGENDLLFDKIKAVVLDSDMYQMKAKYPEIFAWYPNSKELVEILNHLEKDISNDPSIFNAIRKELDWIMRYSYDHGLSSVRFTGSNLAECSSSMGKPELCSIIPLHIQRSVHSATAVCNEGSHRMSIDRLVREGKAPYLTRSTIFEFLNILYWLKDAPETPEDIERTKLLAGGKLRYENKSHAIELDDNGYYHCGECLLSSDYAEKHIGQTVTVYDVRINAAQDQDSYPYFAKFKVRNNFNSDYK